MVCKRLCAGRVSVPGQIHLVTCATYRRQPLFAEFAAARLVIIEMRRLHDSGLIASLAWVLMPDHLHWLLGLGTTHSLQVVLKTLKGRSAQLVNRWRGHHGPVWQAGYHYHARRPAEDLTTAARYIVANPLRAGLVSRIGDYPHWDAAWL